MLPYTPVLLLPQLAATSTAGLECPQPLPPEQVGWEAKRHKVLVLSALKVCFTPVLEAQQLWRC